MPQFCNPKSSSSSSRSTSSKHRRNNNCWRNPCVVFLITFGILFTLRFRTPTTKAAVKLLNKSKQQQARSKQLLAKSKQTTGTTATVDAFSKPKEVMSTEDIVYTQIDQGTHDNGASYVKYQAVDSNDKATSIQAWAQTIYSFTEMVDSLIEIIQDAPYKALYFEMPPTNKASVSSQPFEFVLVDAPNLATFADGKPDATAFSSQFEACRDDASACAFKNLGKDALLIAPKPPSTETDHAAVAPLYYAHLASFLRQAPAIQVRDTWSLVAASLLRRLDDTEDDEEPVWLSTSGMGVAWLHFRLDSRPKYYTHQPYKMFATPTTTSSSQSDI